jgi:putative membrane protein
MSARSEYASTSCLEAVMPSEQRLHPISILFAFAGSLKAFAVPGLLVLVAGRSSSGGADGGFGRLPSSWEVWMMLFLIPAGLIAVARYVSFHVQYESTELVIRSGLVFRNVRHIPYSRIQNLEAVRNVFHRAFGVVEVRVENASGKETEATISVLPLAAFDEMRRRVLEGRGGALEGGGAGTAAEARLGGPVPACAEQTLVHLRLRDLLLFGFIENRGLVVIGAVYGLLWEYGPLSRVWSRVLDQTAYGSGFLRHTLRRALNGQLPPARLVAIGVAGLVGFLIVVRLVSMGWAALRLWDFRLSRVGDDLRTQFGLLTRVATTIPVRRIQTMTFRDSPLHRLLKRVGVRAETAGGQAGTPGGVVDREWLAPLVRLADLPAVTRVIVPEFALERIAWQPVHPGAFRRAVRPAVVWGLALPGMCAPIVGWWAVALAPVTVAWFVFAARKHVTALGWAATDEAVMFRRGWIWRVVTVARLTKVQAVARRESPFDRLWSMARVRVDTAGASERSVRIDIPYLPAEVALALQQRLAGAAATTDFRW